MRGGPGKPKLSREDKVIRLLIGLPHVQFMANNPGKNKNDINGLISETANWRTTIELIADLEASGCITKRAAEKHERGDYYYYVTDKGVTLIEKMKEIRGLRQPLV